MTIKNNFPTIRPSLNLDFANSKQLDPRITFTRASTATYWDGVTQVKAEENLLKYSQEFNSAAGWINGATASIADQATAPDGTTTADLVYPTTTGTLREIYSANQTLTGTHTLSVYVKSAGFRWVYLAFTAGTASTTTGSFFDVIDGLVGTNGNVYNETIAAVGNGWFRLSITVDSTAIQRRFNLGFADANNSFTATASGTSGVFLWGAQLEQRSQATAYTPTTGQPITKYQPVLLTASSEVPRFDHNPVTGESLGLLIEEQRTNLQPYSSDFSNAAWTKINATVTAAAIVAPDGTLTGSQLVESTGTGTPQLIGNVSVTPSTNTNISVYVKAVAGSAQRYVYIGAKYWQSNRWGYYLFNPDTGLVIDSFADGIQDFVSAPIVTPVGNGWFRLSMVFYSPLGGQNLVIGLTNTTTPTNNQTLGSYTGDGTSGIYIWGAQLEAGSFPTSYIPTTTAQVTRAADSASMTGTNFSSWYRQDEGSFVYAAFASFGSGAEANYVVGLGSADNNSFAYAAIYELRRNFSTPSLNEIGQTYSKKRLVSAIAFSTLSNTASAAMAGVLRNDNTSGFYTGTNKVAVKLGIGNSARAISANVTGAITVEKLAYYPKRLSNTELQALTA